MADGCNGYVPDPLAGGDDCATCGRPYADHHAQADFTCVTTVRAHLEEALRLIAQAGGILRTHNCPESAAHLSRSYDHLVVWTQQGGILDCLAAPGSKVG